MDDDQPSLRLLFNLPEIVGEEWINLRSLSHRLFALLAVTIHQSPTLRSVLAGGRHGQDGLNLNLTNPQLLQDMIVFLLHACVIFSRFASGAYSLTEDEEYYYRTATGRDFMRVAHEAMGALHEDVRTLRWIRRRGPRHRLVWHVDDAPLPRMSRFEETAEERFQRWQVQIGAVRRREAAVWPDPVRRPRNIFDSALERRRAAREAGHLPRHRDSGFDASPDRHPPFRPSQSISSHRYSPSETEEETDHPDTWAGRIARLEARHTGNRNRTNAPRQDRTPQDLESDAISSVRGLALEPPDYPPLDTDEDGFFEDSMNQRPLRNHPFSATGPGVDDSEDDPAPWGPRARANRPFYYQPDFDEFENRHEYMGRRRPPPPRAARMRRNRSTFLMPSEDEDETGPYRRSPYDEFDYP